MFKLAGNLVSPAGSRAKLIILAFHRVLQQPDPLLPDEVDASGFERQLVYLKRIFNVVPLGDAVRRMSDGTLPPRALAITFDDGYADNEQRALPILLRHDVVATFFVATGFVDGGAMFNDHVIEIVRSAPDGFHDLAPLGLPSPELSDAASRRECIEALLERLKYKPVTERTQLVHRLAETMRGRLAGDLMMRPPQIRRLADSGMEIGAHTVNHPILMRLDEREARAEIEDGKRHLEQIAGRPVGLFAYPNGRPDRDFGRRDVALVRDAGFDAAVSTAIGVASRDSDPLQLPRVGWWDDSPSRSTARLLMLCTRAAPASVESRV